MARTPDPDLRDRILSAAAPLFYAHGVQAVGLAQVVAAAGCGKNALYRHFGSKADLVAAYLAAFGAQRDVAVAVALEGRDDPADALVALTEEVAANAARPEFQGCAVRSYLREIRRYDDAPGRVATDLLEAWRARIAGLAGRLGLDPADAERLAERICLLHDGVLAGATRDPARAGEAAVGLVRELVYGAANPANVSRRRSTNPSAS